MNFQFQFKFKFIIFFFFFLLLHNQSFAKEKLFQGRLLLGSIDVDPTGVNDITIAQGMEKIDRATLFGIEVTRPFSRYFNVGFRYVTRSILVNENPQSSMTDYQIDGNQESILFMTRFNLIRSSILRFDVFGGFGTSKTSLKIKTSSQDGELSTDWLGSSSTAVGASVGIGFKKIFLFVESGIEKNNVKDFTSIGTINSNIQNLNLNGQYLMFGLIFDGVPAPKK